MIDINYKYAQWSTNVNVSGMNWQTYHEGDWYNPIEKTYDQAVEEIKETIRLKVLKDHPHLTAFDNTYKEVNINGMTYSNGNRPRNHFGEVNNMVSTSPEKTNNPTIEEQPVYKYPTATAEIVKEEMKNYKLSSKIFTAVYGEQVKGNEELEKFYAYKLKQLQYIETESATKKPSKQKQ
jgi:uncharacterized protein with von Willebrand factor type A (vWA) domain